MKGSRERTMGDEKKKKSGGEEKRAEKPRDKRSQQKRGIIIAFAAMLVIVVIFYAAGPIANAVEDFIAQRNEAKRGPTSDYMDHIAGYDFYPSDYSIDITADEEYMKLDRQLHYKYGGETIGLAVDECPRYGLSIGMLGRYFESVKNGEYETYNEYFTDEYFENQTNKAEFTPQKLYDIEVEFISTTELDGGVVSNIYYVRYKIRQNTGTFRNDIGSDMSRDLVYEVREYPDGTALINYIGR